MVWYPLVTLQMCIEANYNRLWCWAANVTHTDGKDKDEKAIKTRGSCSVLCVCYAQAASCKISTKSASY